jgi:hypothetical protein
MKHFSTTLWLLALTALMFGGCATRSELTGPPCKNTPEFEGHWYNSGHVYQMRHEGVLQFGDMTIPMTGLMKLDTKNSTARVAILTSMGIKLLVLDLTKEDHKFLYTSPAANKIPGFKKGAVRAIRSVFLDSFPESQDSCFEVDTVQMYIEKSPSGSVIFEMDSETWDLYAKSTKDWNVTYGEGIEAAGTRLPDEIKYEDRRGRFSVTLKLISAKQQ